MRILELFAGIGGLAAAWPQANIVAAIDISQNARAVYEHNFPHPFWTRSIESLSVDELARLACDCWWLSPPCQPFTAKGNRRDIDDPRSDAFLNVVRCIEEICPSMIALENVPAFASSRSFARLRAVLEKCGYHYALREICPTEMGWPNRRARCYLIASHEPLRTWRRLPRFDVRLRQFLNVPCAEPSLFVPRDIHERFGKAMHQIDIDDPSAAPACFGGGYGKSLLRSGSYLIEQGRMRWFSPREVLNLLGFSPDFQLPELTARTRSAKSSHRPEAEVRDHLRWQWKLAGNSLSLPVVRYVLQHLPDGLGGEADYQGARTL